MLTIDRIRSTLTKDNIGAVGNEKFGMVAKSIRKMSFKKRPLMLTPTTPATPFSVSINVSRVNNIIGGIGVTFHR
jgi:hypothetical protein